MDDDISHLRAVYSSSDVGFLEAVVDVPYSPSDVFLYNFPFDLTGEESRKISTSVSAIMELPRILYLKRKSSDYPREEVYSYPSLDGNVKCIMGKSLNDNGEVFILMVFVETRDNYSYSRMTLEMIQFQNGLVSATIYSPKFIDPNHANTCSYRIGVTVKPGLCGSGLVSSERYPEKARVKELFNTAELAIKEIIFNESSQ